MWYWSYESLSVSGYKKYEIAYWFEKNETQAHEMLKFQSDDNEANTGAKMLIYLTN